jgi:hypothetical protein
MPVRVTAKNEKFPVPLTLSIPMASRHPTACRSLLAALDFHLAHAIEKSSTERLPKMKSTTSRMTATPKTAPAPQPGISARRLEANRRNAQKSTGPKTDEGKQTSRLNASRHGLTAQVRIMPDAERTAAEAFCQPIIKGFAPVGEHETLLARAIADAHWRLSRARAIEENLFAIHIANRQDHSVAGDNHQIADAIHMAQTFAEQPMTFDRLTMYEQRIRRGMERDLKLLEAARKERMAAEAKAFEEARLLFQSAQQNEETFDPEAEARVNGGFVYPIERLEAAIRREQRLSQARPVGNSAKGASAAAYNSLLNALMAA